MGLATLVGACWRALASSIPGFRPLPGNRVVLIGARDLSDAERALIGAAGIRWLTIDALRAGIEGAFAPVLDELRAVGVSRAYVHVDLDVHDPSVAHVNGYQPPGGLSAEDVRRAVRAIRAAFDVAGAAITAYDPECDLERRALPLAAELAATLLEDEQ
jgi:arginase